MISVLGPLHSYPGHRWCFNTGIRGELRGNLKEQVFFGSYHAVLNHPFPEAYAAKVAAAINRDPVVEVWAHERWHFATLTRTIRVPEHWCLGFDAKTGFDRVCAELKSGSARIEIVQPRVS